MQLLCRLSFLALLLQSAHAPCARIASNEDETGAAIFISGSIAEGDAAKFSKAAAKFKSATVVLDSDGGLTVESIRIGEAIRSKGFSTAVKEGARCDSGCALIWVAGTRRSMSDSSKIGFHATYIRRDGVLEEYGLGNAFVGRYLTLLNLSEKALIFATSASPYAINYLTVKNYRDADIDLTVINDLETPAPPPATIAASAIPISAPKGPAPATDLQR